MAEIKAWSQVEISKLKPYKNNAKIHDKEQVRMIADSIKEFGFVSPIIIDSDYNLIAGHGRIEAAKTLGMTEVPAVYVEGLTDAQRRAYILADNRLTELGKWDRELVSMELTALKDEGFNFELTGFTIDDFDFDDIEDTYDDFPDSSSPNTEEEKEPRIHRGEVWQLGDHRLMCGDSTSEADVDKLIGDAVIDLLETDPPYGVDYSEIRAVVIAKTKRVTEEKKQLSKEQKINGDNLSKEQLKSLLTNAFHNASKHMKPGAAFYVWLCDKTRNEFETSIVSEIGEIREVLIWIKCQAMIGRQDYQHKHEPCLYGWKKGGSHYFIDLRNQTTVQEYDELQALTMEELLKRYRELLDDFTTVQHENRPAKSDLHPTMKPLSLIKRHIRNSSREGENVLDLFGGSGTTLIA